MSICLATNNAHKIAEIRAALGEKFLLVSLKDIGCKEELPETQNTISGNSFQKAEYVFKNYNVSCLADDSGLEVKALDGEPGVDSAHYAGLHRSHTDNINLLLKNMEGAATREACFKTILTLILSGGKVHQFEGALEGIILQEKRGISGFGYDPVFLPNGFTRTLAEMSLEEKNKISHRGKAVLKLKEFFRSSPAFIH
jgi:XTP/dITP diphosphohydrolase